MSEYEYYFEDNADDTRFHLLERDTQIHEIAVGCSKAGTRASRERHIAAAVRALKKSALTKEARQAIHDAIRAASQ